MGLWSSYKEGGYDPIIKKGLMVLLKRRGLVANYKTWGYDPIIKKGVMILL
jgi:hypothetical protein